MPDVKLWMEAQRSIPSSVFMTRYVEALPFAPLSESVPSHCLPQCRGCLLLFDCLNLKMKALGAFEMSGAVCVTSQRYVPKPLRFHKDVSQERAVAYLVRFKVQLWYLSHLMPTSCSNMLPCTLWGSRFVLGYHTACEACTVFHMVYLASHPDTVRQHCT